MVVHGFRNTREASMAYRLNQLKSALTISILVAMPNIGHSQSLGYQPDVISPFLYSMRVRKSVLLSRRHP